MQGKQNKKNTFSIIIPSYNEGEDVRLAIESAIDQTYKAKEILVVDDSTDRTPEIIKEYTPQDVILVSGPQRGCCGARNLGMKLARGNIIVLLNSDVALPKDFLERIAKHYEANADYVLVESRVFNLENVWARFIEAQHRLLYGSGRDMEWTEGFSCRRETALKVGLIPGDFPITFCRDWMLGRRLKEAGYKKVIDRSIVVSHKAPETYPEYWRVRKARGRFSSLTQIYILKRPRSFLAFKFFIKDILLFLKFILIFPVSFRVLRTSLYSESSLKDFFRFFPAYFIQECAKALGEWEGLKISFRYGK